MKADGHSATAGTTLPRDTVVLIVEDTATHVNPRRWSPSAWPVRLKIGPLCKVGCDLGSDPYSMPTPP